MTAYQKVYEEKRGHAAGDSDTEKQASQLASDVRYKAKKKVPAGASKEEKRKIFLAILASSPAPNVVKAMAKTKLLGESALLNEIMPAGDTQAERTANVKKVVRGGFTAAKQVAKGIHDIRNSKIGQGVAGISKRKGTLSQKLTGAAIDAVKGGVRSGVTRLQKFANEEKIIEGSAYGIYRGDGKVKIGQPPRKQKGAMAYDGPNKGRSEAADRVLAKTAAKRAKMKEEKEKKMSPTVLDNIRKTNTGAGSQYEEVTNESQAPMGIKKPILGGHTTERPKPKKPGEIGGPLGKLLPKPTVVYAKEAMDPVGQEDGDINNDGKKDSTDSYLMKRRKAIGKAIAKKRGRVKEGFSAWRIELDFNEQVKK